MRFFSFNPVFEYTGSCRDTPRPYYVVCYRILINWSSNLDFARAESCRTSLKFYSATLLTPQFQPCIFVLRHL